LKLWTMYLQGVGTLLCTMSDSDLCLQPMARTSCSSDIPSVCSWFRWDYQTSYEVSFGRPSQVLSTSDHFQDVDVQLSVASLHGSSVCESFILHHRPFIDDGCASFTGCSLAIRYKHTSINSTFFSPSSTSYHSYSAIVYIQIYQQHAHDLCILYCGLFLLHGP